MEHPAERSVHLATPGRRHAEQEETSTEPGGRGEPGWKAFRAVPEPGFDRKGCRPS